MKKVFRLIDAICEARENKNFSPQEGTTFCNVAVNYIAQRVGYEALQGKIANEIVDFLAASRDWLKIEPDVAQYHANNGGLVIAGWKNLAGHGHVAVVRPGEFATSAKLKSDKVPKVLNIGTTIALDKGANYAFGEMPNYFVLKSSISDE